MINDYVNSLIAGRNKPRTSLFGAKDPFTVSQVFGTKQPTVEPNMTPKSNMSANPAAVSPQSLTPSSVVPTKPAITSPAKTAFIQSQTQPQAPSIGTSPAPTTPAPTPPAPTTPEAPKAPTAYESAMTRYIESLTATPEEKALRGNIAKMSAQSAADYEKALQSGETMSFSQGEAGRVNRANQLAIGAQTGALSALEAGRTGDVEANKARVDYLSSLQSTPKQALELKKAQADLDKSIAETAKTTAEISQIGKIKPMTAYEQAKFNQDAAQYGKDYALKVRELGLKEAAAAPSTPANATESIDRALQAAKDAKKYANASGVASPFTNVYRWATGSEAQTDLIAQANTLRTLLMTLKTDPNTKKFFGPAMSNADVQFLMSGGTTLNPELQSPKALKEEIVRVENALNKMKESKVNIKTETPTQNTQVTYNGVLYDVDANGDMTPVK